MAQLIIVLEKSLPQQDCSDALIKVKALKGVFAVSSRNDYLHRITLDDSALPDQVIADAKQVPGVRYVEKVIPHYPC